MKKAVIQIYPAQNTWKQRWTVIWSTIFGKPYHMTISYQNIWKLIDQIYKEDSEEPV